MLIGSLGFTCLIQISTRKEDFIVDPLPLIDELHILNRVTTDPKKVKVNFIVPFAAPVASPLKSPYFSFGSGSLHFDIR